MKSSISYTIEMSNYLNARFSQESLANLNLSLINEFNKRLPSNITKSGRNKLMFSLFPLLLKKEDKQYIERICLSMHKIVEKTIEIFINKREPISNFYEDYNLFIPLIFKQENYYQTISRYDFMINDNGIFFYEFNGCLPGGLFIYDILSKVTLELISKILNTEIGTTFKTDSFYSLVCTLLNLHSFKPLKIALLHDDYKFDCEFQIIKKELESKGISVEISHIKNIKYLGEKVLINQQNIGLAYNNFFLSNSTIDFDKTKWIYSLSSKPYQELIKSSKNGNISLMHGLGQMTIGEDKSIFALLSNTKFMQHFNSEEIELLSKHIPYTERLLGLQDKIKFIQDKDKYILKKYYSQLGAGVYKGQDYSEPAWINLLERYHDQTILQRKIEPLKYPYFDPTNNRGYRYREINLSMSMYIVGGQCSGLIAHLVPDGEQSLLQPVFEII